MEVASLAIDCRSTASYDFLTESRLLLDHNFLMEPPLRHIHSRSLPLESADKLPNMSSCIQDTTYFAVFLPAIQGSNPAICFCYFNTEGRLHRTSLGGTRKPARRRARTQVSSDPARLCFLSIAVYIKLCRTLFQDEFVLVLGTPVCCADVYKCLVS